MGRAAATACLALVVVGCGNDVDDPPMPAAQGMLHLACESGSIAVQPGQSREAVFRLLDAADKPVPERVIQFSIVDNPATSEDEARGATLSVDRGVTNGAGAVTLQIIAGPQPTTFRVRASATRAGTFDLIVLVTTAVVAPAEVSPVLVDAPSGTAPVKTVRMRFIEGVRCAAVDFDKLPPADMTVALGKSALYATVNTQRDHAVVGEGLDEKGALRATACVDLHGASLLVEVPLQLILPLHLLRVSPLGEYEAVSHLQFRATPKSVTAIGEAWKELVECPNDPARLWIDCVRDALKSSATDLSDCRPTEDEGPLGAKLALRRGVTLTTPGVGRCRDKSDAQGKPSLETLVDALFPRSRPPLFVALPALATEATQLFDALTLHSVLTISATTARDTYQLDHRLNAIDFPLGVREPSVDLAQLGAAVRQARFVPVVARQNDLDIGMHGFTLRLGSAARVAFGRTSLAARGAPTDIGAFVTTLFAAATRNEGGTILTGCTAFDALLCPELGEARGCLLTACSDGLAALTRRLLAGFQGLDGDDIDLVLAGSVPALDTDLDRRADALGALATDPPGLWSGEVRGRGGPNQLTGVWTAARTND